MKKIKICSILLSFAMILFIFAACGKKDGVENVDSSKQTQESEAQDKDKKDSSMNGNSQTDKKALRLVGETQFAPISFEENGKVVGINPDILREVFKRMGYEITLELFPWKRAQEMVINGEADALFSPYKTPERELIYDFPDEVLLKEELSFVVPKDSDIKYDGDIKKMGKYTIGTLIGYEIFYDEIEKVDYVKNGTLKLDRTETNSQSLEKMLNKRGVDTVCNTKYVLIDALKKMGKLEQVKFLEPPYKTSNDYLAFSKKKNLKDVLDKFERTLIEVKKDGTYQKIIDKYIK